MQLLSDTETYNFLSSFRQEIESTRTSVLVWFDVATKTSKYIMQMFPFGVICPTASPPQAPLDFFGNTNVNFLISLPNAIFMKAVNVEF
jgi:hypothetical protein